MFSIILFFVIYSATDFDKRKTRRIWAVLLLLELFVYFLIAKSFLSYAL